MTVSAKSPDPNASDAAILHPRTARGEVAAEPSAEMPWFDSHVETSHGRIRVRMSPGEGVTLLLIHGNSASLDIFSDLMSGELRHACRLVAIDLPGHGDSDDAHDPQRTYSIPGYADTVIEVLEELDIAEVAIFGWSLGGHVALELASRFPGVLGVMLCGTPPVGATVDAIMAGFKPNLELGLLGQATLTAAELRAFDRLTTGEAGSERTRSAIKRTDGRARTLMYANLVAGGVRDQRRFVETSAVPIAVVNGANDPLVNVAYLSAVAYSALWYGRVHLIPNGAHAPFLTQRSAFEKVLARFMRSMRRRQRQANRHQDLCFSG